MEFQNRRKRETTKAFDIFLRKSHKSEASIPIIRSNIDQRICFVTVLNIKRPSKRISKIKFLKNKISHLSFEAIKTLCQIMVDHIFSIDLEEFLWQKSKVRFYFDIKFERTFEEF